MYHFHKKHVWHSSYYKHTINLTFIHAQVTCGYSHNYRHLQNHTTLKPHFQLKFRSLLYRKARKLYMYLIDTFWKYISATDSISYFEKHLIVIINI